MGVKEVVVRRFPTSDEGTFGVLTLLDFCCHVLELPWLGNQRNISCIPIGEYPLIWCLSTRFRKKMYLIGDVPNRSGIRIHSGVFAGNRSIGFRAHSNGCPLLGKSRGVFKGQKAIFYSRLAVRNFENLMAGERGKLIIEEG